MDTMRAMVSGAADPSGQSGILASARTPAFNGPAHTITPKTIVTIREEGSQPYDVTVSTAVSMGYLVRNGDTYSETTKAERESAAAAKHAAAAEQQRAEQQASNAGDISQMTPRAFAPEIQSDLEQITTVAGKALGEEAWVPAFAAYVGSSGSAEGKLDQVVGKLGMSREQAQVFIAVARTAFTAQAEAALEAIVGDDVEGFAAWAAEHKPQEFKRAQIAQIWSRSVEGYKGLVDEYFRSNVPSEEMLTRSGFEVARDRGGTGELLVKLDDGQWTSVRVATKQGAFALPRYSKE